MFTFRSSADEKNIKFFKYFKQRDDIILYVLTYTLTAVWRLNYTVES